MKAEDKAKELVDGFSNMFHEKAGLDFFDDSIWRVAKECALICVEQMIVQNGKYYLHNGGKLTEEIFKKENAYLFELKSEIEKL